MIMQQEKNDNDDKKNVLLIEYENITMINKHETNKHKINDYKNIVMTEHEDVRHKNI